MAAATTPKSSPESSTPARTLRVLELYCGIGGVAAALGDRAEVVAAIDIHRTALEVYAHNFRHPTRVANIESIPAPVLRDLDADLWWMSPPCQPFTRRGKRADAEDSRAQGFLRLIETLVQVRPPFVALENVPELQGSRTHARLCEALGRAGYEVREWILCPTDFGAPNRRRRWYLVGSVPSPPWPPSPGPHPLPPGRGAGGEDFRGPGGEGLVGQGLVPYLDPIPEADLAVDPALLDRYRHAVDLVDAEDPDAVTATFTAAYGRSPVRSGSYLRQPDGVVRRFSPREILRLLGFPASYRLPADLPRASAWRMLGSSLSLAPVRAVLCTVMEGVALHPHRPVQSPAASSEVR